MHYFKTHIFPILTLLFLQATITLSDHGHSHDEAPHYKYTRAANEPQKPSTQPPPPPAPPLDMSTLWTNAMTSTFIISAAPFLIILVIPLQDAHSHQSLLKIMLAFASGGLLGDAFLHLIPHAAMAVEKMSPAHSHSHGGGEHEHSHDMSVGLWVLAGIVSFLIVEKSVRIIKGKHGHSHGDKKEVKNKKSKKDGQQASGDLKVDTVETEVKVAGYLNLAADFCHNFTDGLAIGSSYAAGNYVGIVTTVTIFLHEIPHEIGDFAILVQSGVPRTKAIFLQLLTALGAFAGTALPLITQSSAGEIASTWILPFTAGGFIYIALVSVIPELLDEERPSMKQTIYQILAMLFGVYMMVKIAEYE